MIRRHDDFDLSGHNTFRIKARCACYIEYDSIEDLSSLDFDSLPKPIVSLGGGSNVLLTEDFGGTVLHSCINYVKYFDVGADNIPMAVGAGVCWDELVAKTCSDGLWGLENLSLIPGSVGGAAVQNIGAYGAEAKDVIAGVTCFDLRTKTKTAFKLPDCEYGYRDSVFKRPENKSRYIITGVLFRVSRTPKPRVDYGGLKAVFADHAPSSPQEVRDAVIRIRESKLPDPAKIGSAGSFFKNPVLSAMEFARIAVGYESIPHYILDGGFVKVPAAWMIEQCGLKDARFGGAALCPTQPLVIINESGDADAKDILNLEKHIIDSVKTRFGVELHPEVEHIP